MNSQQIQDQINAIDAQIQAGASDAQLNVWEMQKSDLKKQLADTLAAEASQAERTQAQAEKVDSITLPLDFNALFDNTAANDMVIEVVKTFQTQAYADHNAEVAKINADWTDKVNTINTAASDREGQLQRQNKELNDLCDSLTKANADLHLQAGNEILAREDAEQKRDNAVNELEPAKQEIIRLNSHIDDLQQQLANAPAPKAAIEIGSSDRLNELAAKAKESNADKMARALARWNQAQPDMAVDIPVLPQLPEEPPVTPEAFRPDSEAIPDSPVAQQGEGETTGENGTGTDATAQESPVITLESLHERVKALEDRLSPATAGQAAA